MTEPEHSEDSQSDSENRKESEIQQTKKERIAWGLLLRDISDDNPSEKNGYTGFEQIIVYEFQTEDPLLLDELKEDIICIAQDMEDEEETDEIIPDKDPEEEVRILNRIARAVLEEILTDDTISTWSGLTGLEQVIYYEFGPVSSERLVGIKKKLHGIEIDLRGGSLLKKPDKLDNYITEDIN